MTEQEFFDKYPRTLSDQQKTAVLRVDGQTLLLAVPGSGKTTVLIARLGYMLLCKGIDPSNILTITYTVAATKDMSKRFVDTFGEDAARGLEFRTINGLCAKVILEYGRMIGREAYALQTDEGALQGVIRDTLVRHMDEYPADSDIKTARTLITYAKNMMLNSAAIEELGKKEKMECLPQVYSEYNKHLKENHMMDYDDQMVYAYSILMHCPELLGRYRDRFRYISVDEAQDTSKIQHELVRLLVGTDGNLFMVGDEDQSIYGFRAAYPEALLRFTEHHPEGKVLIMDRNFRSGKKIVDSSDSVIRNNRKRHEKHMQAARDASGSVEFVGAETRIRQYRMFVDRISTTDRQTAVLCRENESLVPFVDILDRKGIPFALRGADVSFFTGRVVTDVTNIMELAKKPGDTELFKKVYYKCRTYLKKHEAAAVCRIAEEKNIPIVRAAREADLAPFAVRGVAEFFDQLKGIVSDQPTRALGRIIVSLGYSDYLERLGIKGDRFFALRAVASWESSLNGFLSRMKYLRELMGAGHGKGGENIILSTIHSSKGLEYDDVYLADVCDSVFPSQKPGEDPDTDEEERRLFYVGMTRAKENLYIITYKDAPSTFVKELKQGMQKTGIAPTGTGNSVPVTSLPPLGTKVVQPKYGEGVITWTSRENGGKVGVVFGDSIERSFSLSAFSKGMRIVR